MTQAFAIHHEVFDKDRTKVVVGEYNKRAMIPLLVKVNRFLNLVASHNALENENLFANSFFDVITYMPQKLVKLCLYVKCQCFMILLFLERRLLSL
jgi:hypothetical protein